jgi:hypothetical protein
LTFPSPDTQALTPAFPRCPRFASVLWTLTWESVPMSESSRRVARTILRVPHSIAFCAIEWGYVAAQVSTTPQQKSPALPRGPRSSQRPTINDRRPTGGCPIQSRSVRLSGVTLLPKSQQLATKKPRSSERSFVLANDQRPMTDDRRAGAPFNRVLCD